MDFVLKILPYALLVGLPGLGYFIYAYFRYQAGKYTGWRRIYHPLRLLLAIGLWLGLSEALILVFFAFALAHSSPGLVGAAWLVLALGSYVLSGILLGLWVKGTFIGRIGMALLSTGTAVYVIGFNLIWVCEPLAKGGFGWAQICMGEAYREGRAGVNYPNRERAVKWYIAAAEDGSLLAARKALALLSPKRQERPLLLQQLLEAGYEPGWVQFELYRTTIATTRPNDSAGRQAAQKWLLKAAQSGYGLAVRKWVYDNYHPELGCRWTSRSQEAITWMEKLAVAYDEGWPGLDSDHRAAEDMRMKTKCLAGILEQRQWQDANLANWIRQLASQESKTRINALFNLGRMGSRAREAVPAILQVAQAPNTSLAWNALETLKKIEPDGTATAPSIRAMLEHSAAHIRANGAYAVRVYPDALQDTIPRLVELLDDPSPSVRGRAVLALGSMGARAEMTLPRIEALIRDRRDSIVMSYARQARQEIISALKRRR